MNEKLSETFIIISVVYRFNKVDKKSFHACIGSTFNLFLQLVEHIHP